MTTIRLRTAAAALAVAAIGATIAVTTEMAAEAAPASAATTISFTEANISDRTFNLGSGHGFAVGYVELVANKLMHGGKQVGHDGESYTVTRLGAGSADEIVSAAEVLAHGQIDLGGLVTSTPSGPGTFRLAVTGGTGNYQDARGYATVVPASSPEGHHSPHPVTVKPARPRPARTGRARPAHPSPGPPKAAELANMHPGRQPPKIISGCNIRRSGALRSFKSLAACDSLLGPS